MQACIAVDNTRHTHSISIEETATEYSQTTPQTGQRALLCRLTGCMSAVDCHTDIIHRLSHLPWVSHLACFVSHLCQSVYPARTPPPHNMYTDRQQQGHRLT
ncbi:unnamed protein product [Periconia digitata]|uniref:Uncharacterized protein n=1 Tax=Periconia digitata TaxID=1303443 RepID=A0A9W4UL54_9PLEO|nr:unnamed protein product [Periconia digitata]